jgi:molybdopterin-guanine dinucleotide biosynthesis protein A
MGTDKAMLAVGGVTMLDRALQLLRSIQLAPRIVAARSDLQTQAAVVQDLRMGCGPLSGIEAGLTASHSDLAIFVPVDLPLLTAQCIQILMARASRTGALATVPKVLGQVQPLCAVYHRALLPAVSRSLAAGDYKVMRVIQQAVAALEGSIDIFDLETAMTANSCSQGWPSVTSRAFSNCNSPADLSRVASYLQLHPIA